MGPAPWTWLVSKVSMDWSRCSISKVVCQLSRISTEALKKVVKVEKSAAYVEWSQAAAVGVKGLVVELNKLFCEMQDESEMELYCIRCVL